MAVGIPAAPANDAQRSPGAACGGSQNVPLTDLAAPYRGLDVGLYPGGQTTIPAAHLAAGLERARRIRPLDGNGRPTPDGKIVLMSIGMSNTSTEFNQFIVGARRHPAINRALTILNGSLSGADAAMWRDPKSPLWRNAVSMAGRDRGSASQVQVIWLKQAHLRTAPFPAELDALEADLASIARTAKAIFPNLQLVYVSSRTRAGAITRQGPGEPQAYESAFAVRRLIQDQIEGDADVTVDQVGWLGWGPYLWSNGMPRSDGFVWDCADLRDDMIHPTPSGDQKVADQLMAFFMTADTSVGWFLEASRRGGGPSINRIVPSVEAGPAPLVVDFTAEVSRATQYFWSYADGTYSTVRHPRKTFHLSGRYSATLTAVDGSGRWSRASTEISVGASRD